MGTNACSSQVSSRSPSCANPPSRVDSIPSQNLMWPSQQTESSDGPVAILWDFENCPIPSNIRTEDIAVNIRTALQVHPLIKGAVTVFSAYGDFNSFPRRHREGCQRTGVKLIDVPHGRKDAADKAILIDMFLFALDNPPPSSIMLISGDVDFAPALHILGQRGYTIILVIPEGAVSSALSGAGNFVWDWPSVAHGGGFLPPKMNVRGSDSIICCRSFHSVDSSTPTEEKIVFQGTAPSDNAAYFNMDETCRFHPESMARAYMGLSSNLISTTSLKCRNIPSCQNGSLQDNCQNLTTWVQPGDLQGLKAQMVRLLELSGGCLLLQRVPSDYHKMFGRPLFVMEYGERKLVNLLKKMTDILTMEKKGNKSFVLLRAPVEISEKSCPFSGRKDNKEKRIAEQIHGLVECSDVTCNVDELSDDGRFSGQDEQVASNEEAVCILDDILEQFRQELQELLVSHGCKILFELFESLYEQRYKKTLNYRSFGVEKLDDLLDLVRDVVLVINNKSRRVLVAR